MSDRKPPKTNGQDPFYPSTDYERYEVFMKAADEFDRKYMSTPEKAREQLIREGLLTAEGKWAPPFGDD